VVYFTQGAGELAIDPQPGELADALRKASQLKTALQAEGCDVRTLRLSAQDPNPKVPDDATIVVVADPTSTLNPAMVTAITNYMKKPSDKAPSGKLIVIAQAHPKPGNTPGVLEIGLESLLAEQGVVLANKLLLASSTDQNPPNQHFVRAYQPLINSRNPIALSLQRKLLVASNPRPIGFERQTGQASPWTTTALLHTYESRIPWLESYVPADMNQAEREFVAGVQAKRPEVLDKILVNPRTDELVMTATAVLVTQNVDAETKMGRVAVFSFADFFTDLDAATSPGGELLAATTNWLRDRPAIATIAPKEYGVYRPKLDMNWNSVFWFPVGLMLFCVITAGLGTWMIRRK
jgi:hypothetical protein